MTHSTNNSMNIHISHLICDCDGVLLDSESIALSVLHRQLTPYLSHSMQPSILHSAIAERLGMMTDQLLDEINREFKLGLVATDYSAINAVVSRACSDEVNPVPGVRQALAAIALPKAVASNSSAGANHPGAR